MGTDYPSEGWTGQESQGTNYVRSIKGLVSPKINLVSCSSPRIEVNANDVTEVYESTDGLNWGSRIRASNGYYSLKKDSQYVKILANKIYSVSLWDFEDSNVESYRGVATCVVNSGGLTLKGFRAFNYDGSDPIMSTSNITADVIETEGVNLSKCQKPVLLHNFGYIETSVDGESYSTNILNDRFPTPLFIPSSVVSLRFRLPGWYTAQQPLSNGKLSVSPYFSIYDFGDGIDKGSDGKVTYEIEFKTVKADVDKVNAPGATKELVLIDVSPWVFSSYKSSSSGWPNFFFSFQKIGDKWFIIDQNAIHQDAELIAAYVYEDAVITGVNSLGSVSNGYNYQYKNAVSSSFGGLATYDIDGDGLFEEISNYGEITRYIDGKYVKITSYENVDNYDSSTGFRTVNGFGDFNSDGFIDIATTNGIHLGRKDFKFDHYTAEDFDSKVNNDNGKESVYVADADNDGHMELLYGRNVEANNISSSYLKFGYDNLPLPHKLNVVDPNQKEYVVSYGDKGLPSVADGMFVGGGSASSECTEALSVDINGDGVMDIVTDSEFLIGTTDGTYLQNLISGKITLRDFNGDGVLDYVGNDQSGQKVSLFIVRQDGQKPTEVKLLNGVAANDKIYCFDFDKDGDTDILIPCDKIVAKHDNGASYLIVMENQGNGKFKRREHAIEAKCEFTNCLDFDGDGSYEVIFKLFDGTSTSKWENRYVRLNGVKGISEQMECASAYYNISNLMNDGKMYSPENGITLMSDYVNERPTPPARPTVNYDKTTSRLTISWGLGADKESSPMDLSYALRVGKTPDGCEIVNPHALSDGRRRDLRDGNMGYAHQRVIDVSTWEKGKYYISVQSVDPNRLGSVFSDVAVFDKTDEAMAFDVAYSSPLCVGDTCYVTLSNPEAKLEIDMSFTGLAEDEAYQIYHTGKNIEKIRFNTPGEYTLKLSGIHSKSVMVKVNPASYKEEYLVLDNYSVDQFGNLVDFDCDGHYEIINTNRGSSASYTDTKLYEYNPDDPNAYSSVKKIWNSNMPGAHFGNYLVFDINHDGLSDLVYNNYSQSLFSVMNEGEMDGTVEKTPVQSKFYTYDFIDWNNDGKMDVIDNNDIIITQTKDELDFVSENYGRNYSYIDVNGDGLIDAVNSLKVYLNKGKIPFEYGFDLGFKKSGSYSFIDDNGKVDLIYCDSNKKITEIHWDDNTSTKIDGYYFSEYDYIIADINNDGLNDIVANARNSFSGKDHAIVVYQYPNHRMEVTCYDKNLRITSSIKRFFRDADGRMRMGGLVLTADNTTPKAPANLRYTQNKEYVVIEWDHAEDAESSSWQMQYCLSMKKKGMDGEGAYVFSPLNGGNENVPLPQPYPYIKANRFTIPIENLAPGEYEVRVQALDAWMEQSPFSDTLNLTVKASADFNMPVSARVGSPVTVELLTNTSVTPGFDGATVVSKDGNSYSVVWDTVGEKTVSAGSVSQKITVIDAPQGDFAIAAGAYMGDTRVVECENPMSGSWSCKLNGKDAEEKCAILFNDNMLSVTFRFPGTYTVIHTVSDSNGEYEYVHEVSVAKTGTIDIDFVNCDGASGKFSFTALKGNDMQVAYDVYKETSEAGSYSKVAENQPFGVPFIDRASSPAVSAARYKVCGVYADGSISAFSEIHQPVHLMLNRGIGNGWNLIWSKYEGRDIASYDILRGTSPASLSVIATVSGSLSSYSDTDAPSGRLFYAVQPVPASSSLAAGRADIQVRSNVVSTDDARSVDYATSIVIVNMGATDEVNETTDAQLVAYITPVSATIRNLNWSISEGEEYAEIDRYGVVRVKPGNGGGNIIVNASTVDGTNLTATYTLHYAAPAVDVTSIALSDNTITGSVGDDFILSAAVSPENVSDRRVSFRSTDESVVYIDSNGHGILIGEGEADIIVASVSNPSVTATCHVRVYDGAGVDGIHNDDISVEVFNGEVRVKGVPCGQRVAILNIAGASVFNRVADGEVLTYRPSVKGVYIVVAGSVIEKVAVN